MEKLNYKELVIKPHNILVSVTSEPDYEMSRFILLDNFDFTYTVIEGWHCSCYDFDDTEWEAIKYTEEELLKLAKADYNKDEYFWKEVRKQVRL